VQRLESSVVTQKYTFKFTVLAAFSSSAIKFSCASTFTISASSSEHETNGIYCHLFFLLLSIAATFTSLRLFLSAPLNVACRKTFTSFPWQSICIHTSAKANDILQLVSPNPIILYFFTLVFFDLTKGCGFIRISILRPYSYSLGKLAFAPSCFDFF